MRFLNEIAAALKLPGVNRSLRREQLPLNVSRHPEFGLMFTRADEYSASINMRKVIAPDRMPAILSFSGRAKEQGPYVAELNARFPKYFPRFYGFADSSQTSYAMEYIPGRTVFDYLSNKEGVIPSSVLARIYAARNEIHQAGYAHGDLSTRNVVLMLDEQNQPVDFRFIDPTPPVLIKEPENKSIDTSRTGLISLLQQDDILKMSGWLDNIPDFSKK